MTLSWKNKNIAAFPADYNGNKEASEYITLSIVVGKSEQKYGGGKGPQNGSLICEIYTKSGQGQLRTAQIADAIDDLLENTMLLISGVDFTTSFVGTPATDTANTALSRAIYTLPFRTFGERN